MSESLTTPPPSDDLPAAFNLAVGLLKERRHLGFDELADVLKSCGYPVAGEHPYIYRQNTCLLAWGRHVSFVLDGRRAVAPSSASGSSRSWIPDLPSIPPT